MFNSDLKLWHDFLGDKTFQEATNIDCQQFISYLISDRGNLPQTVNRKIITISNFYKAMIKHDVLQHNPFDKVDKMKQRTKVHEYLTIDELNILIQTTIDTGDLRGKAFLKLAFSTACRIGELVLISKASINDSGVLIVLGKGQKERQVSISDYALQDIKEYLITRGKDNCPYLFADNNGRQWKIRSIQAWLSALGKKAGLNKNIHPHILRHSRAMFLLENDVPLDIIKGVLGHQSITTTQIYATQSFLSIESKVKMIDKEVNLL